MPPSSNGPSRVSSPPSSSVIPNDPRTQQNIASMATKSVVDGQRKQNSSPMDQTQRKPPAVPAWSKGSTNPVTNRPSGGATTNGVTTSSNRSVSSNSQRNSSNNAKDSSMAYSNPDDRMVFLLQNAKGYHVTVTQRDGSKYTGIFQSSNTNQSDLKYDFIMVKKQNLHEGQTNGASDNEAYVGTGDEFKKQFSAKDIVDIQIHDVRFDQRQPGQNGASRFKTDADISSGFAARERHLQRWDGGNDTASSLTSGLESSSGGEWDQFAANERLFGVTTGFDESLYTTTIDRSRPGFKQQEAKAELLAREIVGSSAMNAHILEERGLKPTEDDGEDEESKYSGVRRDFQSLTSGQPDKYTPPARRAPSGQTAATGAPVDPAIISSALAKPNKTATPSKENLPIKKPVASPLAKSPKLEESSKVPVVNTPAKSPLDKVIPQQNKSSASKDGNATATATVEKDVVNAFKAFTATEKLRAQEHQRAAAKRDKAVKLNDLKKFALNFKLYTPVPQDLVPILAKDKHKQESIVVNALKNVEEFHTAPPKVEAVPATPATETKATKPAAPRAPSNPAIPTERQPQRPSKPGPSSFVPSNRSNGPQQIPTMARPNSHVPPRSGNNPYSRQSGMPPINHMQDPRLPPSGPAIPTGFTSPPQRGLHYNKHTIKEFKPDPSAGAFHPTTPITSGPSPVHEPRRPQQGNFFAGRRPILSREHRLSIKDNFNPIKTALKQAKAHANKEHETNIQYNGGFIRIWTNVVWPIPDSNKGYSEILERYAPQSVSPQNHLNNAPMPHQHQLPMHLQSGTPIPQGPTPHQTPRHVPVQPHINDPQHYNGHHQMQHSYSQSSVHPSPRGIQNHMVPYQGQQQMPMYQQGVTTYGMSPGGYPMSHRQVSGGQQYLPPSAPMGGHMMATQQSAGPFMNPMGQQVQMYSQTPNQAYPHPNGPMPQAASQGFGSPRQPHMMVPQGSQQGHPVMYQQHQPQQGGYMQTPNGHMNQMRPGYGPPQQGYGTSPHQMHHFPQQQQMRGTPSATYAQPMMQGHGMAPQPIPPNAAPQMPADGSEDVK